MNPQRTRIVVGEGQAMRKGLLRFVLEGEGYDVAAEASNAADLARVLAIHQPDVVVLDDGIGATAVQMAREVAPKTKVILVWPGAVVPIGGDARVEPAEVLKQLGAAVQRVTGRATPAVATFERPAWIDKVRKDPATLRDMIEKSGGLPKRPSVTELQRRGQRLHPPATPPVRGDQPAPGTDAPGAPAAGVDPPVVILPTTTPGADDDEPVVVLDGATPPPTLAPAGAAPDADAGEDERDAAVLAFPAATATAAVAARSDDPLATEWNRRLGTIALGGAAVAGALVIALSLGSLRIPTDVVAAERPVPATPSVAPPTPGGEQEPEGPGDGNPGNPRGSDRPDPKVTPETPDATDPTPVVDGDDPPAEPSPPSVPPPPDDDGGPDRPPVVPAPPTLPGLSSLNPHGGPPGITGIRPTGDMSGNAPPEHAGGNGGTNGGGNGGGNGAAAGATQGEHPGQGGEHGRSGQHGNAFGIHKHKQ